MSIKSSSRRIFYELATPVTPKATHDCVQHVLFARRMSNGPSTEKN